MNTWEIAELGGDLPGLAVDSGQDRPDSLPWLLGIL